MNSERIDPELLAAFLDGTVSPEEHEEVVRTLARSKEAYADFIEASAVRRNIEAAVPGPTLVTSPSMGRTVRPTRRRWLVGSVVLAASVVGVIATAVLRDRDPAQAIRLAQETHLTRESGPGSVLRQLGPGWDQPVWSTTRGTGGSTLMAQTAFRLGARFADFEFAAQAQDSAATRRAVGFLSDGLQGVEAGAPFAESLRGLARSTTETVPADRAAVAVELRKLLRANNWFDLGIWTETARLAVLARDVGFFDAAGPGIAMLREISTTRDASLAQEWQAATQPLLPLLAAGSLSLNDLPAIDQAIRAAMVAAGR